jgi:hypothetical protein
MNQFHSYALSLSHGKPCQLPPGGSPTIEQQFINLSLFYRKASAKNNLKKQNGQAQTSLPILSRIEKLLLESSNSLLELINASAGVNKLLLTGEEGVALGADINSLLAALGGSGLYNLTACATNGANFVIRMDSVFHVPVPLF